MRAHVRLLLLSFLVAAHAPGQFTGNFTPQPFNAANTGASMSVNGFSYATLSLRGNFSAVTFVVLGSNDGGVSFFPVPFAAVAMPGTLMMSATVTSPGLYAVSLAGLTNIAIQTTSFTGTFCVFKFTGSQTAGRSLPGTGQMGATGATGADGLPGKDGVDGKDGAPGLAGATGPPGAAGKDGAPGATGAIGATGGVGMAGLAGQVGATGQTGAAGKDGAPGATGATGATGSAGIAGQQGLPGAPGQQGVAGKDGAAGATGATGAVGATGGTGAQGLAGATGATGQTGQPGATGATGATGAAGSNGSNGSNGAVGATGATGATGLAGTPGATGNTGATGSPGATGSVGPAGPSDLVGTASAAQAILSAGCGTAITATVSGVTSAYAGHRVEAFHADGTFPPAGGYYSGAVSSAGVVQVKQCSTLAISLTMPATTLRVYVSQN